MEAVNERAWRRLTAELFDLERLGGGEKILGCGARVVDLGVRTPGGLEAGLVMAEVGMGGLGTARLDLGELAGAAWPWVTVESGSPQLGCFLSQAAHWPVQVGDYRAMGSGPACLLNPGLDPMKKFGYHEMTGHGVLVLESGDVPNDAVCRELAAGCGLDPAALSVLVAPTSSLAGSVQIAARSVETALHKLVHLGFDLSHVAAGMGKCPLSGPTGNDLTALGRTNDMVFFGCRVWLAVRGVPDAELAGLAQRVPAATSPSYGQTFLEILRQAGGFYAVDPGLFAPAEITLTNLDSGVAHHAGEIHAEQLLDLMKG